MASEHSSTLIFPPPTWAVHGSDMNTSREGFIEAATHPSTSRCRCFWGFVYTLLSEDCMLWNASPEDWFCPTTGVKSECCWACPPLLTALSHGFFLQHNRKRAHQHSTVQVYCNIFHKLQILSKVHNEKHFQCEIMAHTSHWILLSWY